MEEESNQDTLHDKLEQYEKNILKLAEELEDQCNAGYEILEAMSRRCASIYTWINNIQTIFRHARTHHFSHRDEMDVNRYLRQLYRKNEYSLKSIDIHDMDEKNTEICDLLDDMQDIMDDIIEQDHNETMGAAKRP